MDVRNRDQSDDPIGGDNRERWDASSFMRSPWPSAVKNRSSRGGSKGAKELAVLEHELGEVAGVRRPESAAWHVSRTTQIATSLGRMAAVTRLASPLGMLLVLLVPGCVGSGDYAGLSRTEAVNVAKRQIESRLDSDKVPYYEVSVSHVAAQHGRTEGNAPAWLIGIWNGQADRGDCALVNQRNGRKHVQVIPCAAFPKFDASAVPLPSGR